MFHKKEIKDLASEVNTLKIKMGLRAQEEENFDDRLEALDTKVAELDEKVELILKHLGVTYWAAHKRTHSTEIPAQLRAAPRKRGRRPKNAQRETF